MEAPTKVNDNIKLEISSIDWQIHGPWGLECSQIKACLYNFWRNIWKMIEISTAKTCTFLMIMFRYDEHVRLWWLSAPGVIHTPPQWKLNISWKRLRAPPLNYCKRITFGSVFFLAPLAVEFSAKSSTSLNVYY